MINGQKKAFDSTVCYTFFGSWHETIEGLETDADKKSPAYQLYSAISSYSLYDVEPDFSSLEPQARLFLQSFWKTISSDIDSSKAKRKQGFAPEKPTEAQEAIIREYIKRPDASVRCIAEATGTSKSVVDRTKKKYATQIREGVEALKRNATVCPAPIGDSIGTPEAETYDCLAQGSNNAGIPEVETPYRENEYSEFTDTADELPF